MSLVRGSSGLIYFSHQFQPSFIEAGLLADQEMTAAVKGINEQVHALAGVINSPTIDGGVTVASSAKEVPVEAVAKRRDGAAYVFAVGMRAGPTTATFTVAGQTGKAKVEVMGEDRTLDATDGRFQDKFEPWAVHLYRIK
jgi:hypothetical protein